MKHVAGIALYLLLVAPCAALGASGGAGLAVTPLDDEFAGRSAPLYTPPGPKGTGSGEAPDASGNAGTGERAVHPEAIHSGTASPGAVPANGAEGAGEYAAPGSPGLGGGKDAVVIAYLIDLARKQNRPCPSGETFPVPPSLMFSEPLCKAAQAVRGGAEPLAAMAEQGVHAARWRMFNAKDAPAQRVVNGLRQAHCEALLEPYTHIGAYRDSSGWRILLATLAEKPAGEAGDLARKDGGEAETGDADRGNPPDSTVPAVAPAVDEGAPAAISGTRKPEASEMSGISGQEARSLFMRLNELRARGGMCFSREFPPAPAMTFNPELQALAEKDVRAASGGNARSTADWASGVLYRGSNVTKLTLKASNQASVALDVWMLNPSQCEMLLSPMFTDAGAAYDDGFWVLILGGRNVGVPSDK